MNQDLAICSLSVATSRVHSSCANLNRRTGCVPGSGPLSLAQPFGCLRSFAPASAATKVGRRGCVEFSLNLVNVHTPGTRMCLISSHLEKIFERSWS